MLARYGLLVQMCQLLAQLFLDWSRQRQVSDETFTFLVPGETLEGLPEEFQGVLVTIAPVRERITRVRFTELGIVQAIAGTIGNKDWQPPP